ncbi:hypothetical protein [Streptomyces sp. NPDC001876]|uniref:hypothetical protein n=1 Tax=Streptomyces sp. NPDC001876 TaxID=3154402 RepID=UPI00331DD11D
MSNGISYPVFRTPDRALALRVARQMVAFGVQSFSDVSVEAQVPTLTDARRIRDALPEAGFTSWTAPVDPGPGVLDLFGGVPARELPDDLARVEEFLPFTVHLQEQPVGSIEDHFASAVSPHPARIHWDGLVWPAAPERDLYGEGTHAEVTLLLNCGSIELDVRADTHSVLVHVRRRSDGDDERFAGWLAEQIGQRVIGPPHG